MTKHQLFLVAAKRTPFGTFGGVLKDISATDLGVVASKAAIAQAAIDPAVIDNVVVGLVSQSSSDSAYTARHVALKSGVPVPVPALTVNRLCGSGFQSVINVAQSILLGESKVGLAVGTENMSIAPFCARGIRWGIKFGQENKLEDSLWDALTDTYAGIPMAITAENLAQQYNLTRKECDEYALQSQQRWTHADANGYFASELAPVEIKDKKKGSTFFSKDEHPRPQTTIEGLAKLPPVFKKDGVVTAGSASGISDGAGAVIVASEEAVKTHGLKPLAKLVGWHVAGVDPKIMGIGPVPAIRGVLAKAKLELNDIDLVEINEAFAAQYLACKKELGLNNDKSNINGGAIALGHPLAASGSRITSHLVYQLKRTNKKYAIGAACIGGGQGIALLLENVH